MNLKKRIENLEKHANAIEDQRPPDPEVERLSGAIYTLWMACSFDGPTEEDTAAQWELLYAAAEEYWQAVEASGIPDPYPDFRRLKNHTREPMTPRWWPLRWHPVQAAARAAAGMGFVYEGDLVMLAGTDMVFRRGDGQQP
jgi:hypothetical protein